MTCACASPELGQANLARGKKFPKKTKQKNRRFFKKQVSALFFQGFWLNKKSKTIENTRKNQVFWKIFVVVFCFFKNFFPLANLKGLELAGAGWKWLELKTEIKFCCNRLVPPLGIHIAPHFSNHFWLCLDCQKLVGPKIDNYTSIRLSAIGTWETIHYVIKTW